MVSCYNDRESKKYDYINFICTNIDQTNFNEKMVKTIINTNIYDHIKKVTSGKYGDFSDKMLENLKYKRIEGYDIIGEDKLYLNISLDIKIRACNYNDKKNIAWWVTMGHCEQSPTKFYEDDFQTIINIEYPINLKVAKQLYIDCYGEDDIDEQIKYDEECLV
mgnify:CR=1 FL=1